MSRKKVLGHGTFLILESGSQASSYLQWQDSSYIPDSCHFFSIVYLNIFLFLFLF